MLAEPIFVQELRELGRLPRTSFADNNDDWVSLSILSTLGSD